VRFYLQNALIPLPQHLLLLLLLLLQGASTTVAERVLRVSWPILPIGLVLSTAVCAFVLWRSAAQGGGLQYQQAVAAHGA
jgi:hypothetical protein